MPSAPQHSDVKVYPTILNLGSYELRRAQMELSDINVVVTGTEKVPFEIETSSADVTARFKYAEVLSGAEGNKTRMVVGVLLSSSKLGLINEAVTITVPSKQSRFVVPIRGLVTRP